MTHRILFFGMFGEFSITALRGLMADSSVNVCAVVTFDASAYAAEPRLIALPKSSNFLNLFPRNDLLTLTSDRDLPLYAISSFDYLDFVRDFAPDFIFTACFPQIFPPELLALPKHGCLNLHPSLLPNYRGGAPLFWQFYFGEANTGVTVHLMDAHADTGDIVAQTQVSLPDGLLTYEADRLLAHEGTKLAIHALKQAVLPRQSQSKPTTAYARYPTETDRVIPTSWSARRAFNFLRGAEEWSPLWIEVQGVRKPVTYAVDYVLDGVNNETAPTQLKGEDRIRFADGFLIIR